MRIVAKGDHVTSAIALAAEGVGVAARGPLQDFAAFVTTPRKKALSVALRAALGT